MLFLFVLFSSAVLDLYCFLSFRFCVKHFVALFRKVHVNKVYNNNAIIVIIMKIKEATILFPNYK